MNGPLPSDAPSCTRTDRLRVVRRRRLRKVTAFARREHTGTPFPPTVKRPGALSAPPMRRVALRGRSSPPKTFPQASYPDLRG